MTLPTTETVLSGAATLILGRITSYDDDINPFQRMLTTSDPNTSVGVFPSIWLPDEDSFEMKNQGGPNEPTLQRYQIGLHILTKDSDRLRGLATHTAYARHVRMVLYRDNLLRLGLGQLTVTDSWGTESFRRGWINSHRYLSTEIGNNTLAYLSVLDFTLETEMR